MANIATSRSNMRKGVFKNTRTALLSGSPSYSTRVYGAYPLTKITLPLVVVESTEKGEDMVSLNDKMSTPLSVVVSIYSKQAEKLDTMSDEITAKIEGYETTFGSYGLYLMENAVVDNGPVGPFTDTENNRIHSKILTINFEL